MTFSNIIAWISLSGIDGVVIRMCRGADARLFAPAVGNGFISARFPLFCFVYSLGRTHRSAPTAVCLRSLKSLRILGSLRSLWPTLCLFRAFCRGRPVCLPFIVLGLHIVPLS